MKNKILRRITVVTAIALFIITILTIVSFIVVSINDSEKEVFAFAESSNAQIERFEKLDDLNKFIYYKTGSNIGITIISSDGDVIKDTSGTGSLVDQNLLDNTEVQSIIKQEPGATASKIDSPYIGKSYMYTYYVKVATADTVDPNGFLIVRYSINIILGSAPFWILFITLMLFWAVMVVVLSVIFNLNIKASMTPLSKVESIMKDIQSGEYKPTNTGSPIWVASEADKMVQSIDAIGGMINESLAALKVLIESIKQGVIAFDRQQNVVLENNEAKRFIGADVRNLVNLKEVFNKADVYDRIINSYYNKVEDHFEIEFNKLWLRVEIVFTDNITDNDTSMYMLLVLTDITKEINDLQYKNEFFANASHELKTPLTAVSGYSEMLMMEGITEKQISKCASEINNNAIRMKSLIEDMLQLSKMESNTFIVEKEDIAMRELVDTIADELSVIAEKKGVEIQVDGEMQLRASKKMMMILMKNLISNAIKYNKQNGYVKVLLEDNKHTKIIKVSDNGIGIKKENIEKIFERFYREEEGRTIKEHEESSTGLGLAIVKEIVEKNNGKINVYSEEGKGTEFVVTFKG